MAMLAERHSPSHRKNHSKNISCAHLNIPDISTGSTGNLSENNTSLEDKELNQRLKILTDDLILNMDTEISHMPLQERSPPIQKTRQSRRSSGHYIDDPYSMRILTSDAISDNNRLHCISSDNKAMIEQHFAVISSMLIRDCDYIKVVVNLESSDGSSGRYRYLVVVVTKDTKHVDEAAILGIDIIEATTSSGSTSGGATCTIGLVLPVFSDTSITLDGDGGFSVSSNHDVHIFKPVSIQAMWSALQSLMSVSDNARLHKHHSGQQSAIHWTSYYLSLKKSSCQEYINDWNIMKGIESHRENIIMQPNTEKEKTEKEIRKKLKTLMMMVDLDEMTSFMLRSKLEETMKVKLQEYCAFIDNEMIKILRQMDAASMIFEYLYLGSEWNASNLKELKANGIGNILNVSCEIDNFYPGEMHYKNIRVYDSENEPLIQYWQDSFKYIDNARQNGEKVLVHCKMGISRSASTVIAYTMKANDWSLDRAFEHVHQLRPCIKPNSGFMQQLHTYQGILIASKHRNNHLWRSFSMGNLENITKRSIIDETDAASSSTGSAPASIRSRPSFKRPLCCMDGDSHFQIDNCQDNAPSVIFNKNVVEPPPMNNVSERLLPPRPGHLVSSSSACALHDACTAADSFSDSISSVSNTGQHCDIRFSLDDVNDSPMISITKDCEIIKNCKYREKSKSMQNMNNLTDIIIKIRKRHTWHGDFYIS